MLTTFSLGAEIDVATGDELAGAKGAILSSLAGSQEPRPIRLTMAGAAYGVSPQVIDLGRPPRGRIWGVIACTLVGADSFTAMTGSGIVNTTGSVGIAAGANATLFLSNNGDTLSGFDIVFAPPAAAFIATITVGNLLGTSNIVYTYTVPVGGSTFSERYPNPLSAVGPGAQISINVAAVAGGSAGSIIAFGQHVTGTPLCSLFVGDISNYGLLQCRVPALNVPSFNTFTSDGLWVHDSESLFIVTNGVLAGAQVAAIAQIEEWRESEISMSDGS